MSRLIDADALIENHFSPEHRIALSYANKVWMRKIINDAPTIEPERKKGKWSSDDLFGEESGMFYSCSECGVQVVGKKNYCPNCGAYMREKEGQVDDII